MTPVWLIFITLATLPLVSAELERLEDWLAGADSVERGVFGSPSVFVDGELYFGKDRLRDVEEAILAR